jgi:uncharacterized protein YhaN
MNTRSGFHSLRIHSVTADRFGGLGDRSIDLEGRPFVVISGRNESGKSSLSTLISWLLVGPFGRGNTLAELAHRFGDPGSRIGGTLTASLGPLDVTSTGNFEVTKTGAPNERGLTVRVSGEELSAAAWRTQHLGGIDHAMLTSVYALAGTSLHDDADVVTRIQALAVGGSANADRAIKAVGKLEESARKLLTGRAAEDVSVTQLSKAITRVNKDLREAKEHAERFAGQRVRLDELTAKLDALDTSHHDLKQRERSINDLRSAIQNLQEAIEACDKQRVELGLTHDEAAELHLDVVAFKALNRADGSLSLLRSNLTTSARRLKGATETLELLPTPPESTVIIDSEDRDDLRWDIKKLAEIEGTCSVLEKQLEEDEGKLRSAELTTKAAQETWEQLNTGIDARAWIGRTAARSQTGNRTWGTLPLYAVAALAVVCLAILLAPAVIAIVAVLLAMAGFFLIARRTSDNVNGTSAEQVTAMATAVHDAMERTTTLRSSVVQLRSDLKRERGAWQELASTISDKAGRSGLSLTGRSNELERQIEECWTASETARAHAAAAESLDVAKQEENDAREKLERHENGIREILTNAGVPPRLTVDDAIAVGSELNSLSTLRSNAVGKRKSAESCLLRYLSHPPEGETVALLTLDEFLEDIDPEALSTELSRVKEQIQDLDDSRSELNREIGGIDTTLKGAEKNEVVAGLRLELGNLEEQRTEQLIDGCAAELARVLLAEVTEEQQRRNQPAMVKTTTRLLNEVVPNWGEPRLEIVDGSTAVRVHQSGAILTLNKLSTAGRALLYLALRLAAAEQDASQRGNGLRFPLLCDDPLVHFDEDRAVEATKLLAAACDDGHQVVIFTCHRRTEEAAVAAGAPLISLS